MLRTLAVKPSRHPRLLLRRQLSSLATAVECVAVTRLVPARALSSVQLQSFDAMKSLVDTLHMATLSPCTKLYTPRYELHSIHPNSSPFAMLRTAMKDLNARVSARFVLEQKALSESRILTLPMGEVTQTITSDIANDFLVRDQETRSSYKKVPTAPSPTRILNKLQFLMNEGDSKAVACLVQKSSQDGIRFPKGPLYNCYRFMLTRNPVYAYDILCTYRKQYAADDLMYERLCQSIADLLTSHEASCKTRTTVLRLRQDCERMPREKQQVLLPILLESMVTTGVGSVRVQSLGLYDYLCEHDFDLSPNLLERLLAKSRYWSDDLPYHRVLERLAQSQAPLMNANVITQALANMFPFTDDDKTLVAVKAILAIVSRGDTHVRIDRGMLEQILAGAARVGNYELGLTTWDLVEILGYKPTDSLFESMIQAFSMAYKQDHRVFSCLAGMEDYGYIPSRALIRSVSRSLRYSINRVDNAYRFITNRVHGCRPSLYSLNVIMSACAECGDVERTLSVLFDDFPTYQIEPNDDSFSFAMEALAVNARVKEAGFEKESLVEAAEDLLNMMSKRHLAVDRHVFHEYIRVLLNSGELEMATASTFDAIRTRTYEVDNKTIVILINSLCVDSGCFDVARQLASLGTEPLPFLLKKIERYEKGKRNRNLTTTTHPPGFDDDIHEELESGRNVGRHP